ncbi:MAG TPA: HD domain-containing protein [Victivallales bacterium]|nr:HD domain-containing protein [Victivallales bacterium]
MKIKIEILLLVLLVLVIPMSIINIFTYYFGKELIKKQAIAQLTLFVDSKEAEILLYFNSLKTRAIDFSSDGYIRKTLTSITQNDDKEELKQKLKHHLLINKKSLDINLNGVSIFDIQNKLIVTTCKKNIDNYSKQKNRSVTGNERIFFSDLYKGKSGIVDMDIAVPLTKVNKPLQRIGTIVIHYKMQGIIDILTGTTALKLGAQTQSGKLDKSVNIYLTNSDGIIISNSIKKLPSNQITSLYPVKIGISTNREVSGSWKDYNGVGVVGASMIFKYNSIKWILVAEQSQDEAYRYLNYWWRYILLMGLITLAIILLIGILLSNSIVIPIKKLKKGIEFVTTGNLNYKFDMKSSNEIAQLSIPFEEMLKKLQQTTASRDALNKEIKRRIAAELDTQVIRDITVERLANIIEHRDNDSGFHIRRTKYYIKNLGIELSKNNKYHLLLDRKNLTSIIKAAPLHDIGKVGIPDSILLKPGELTSKEFSIMKKHTEIGRDILKTKKYQVEKNSFIRHALDIVYCHHEKWDGTGYPSGLKGEKIPFSARLMAVADVYDALTSKRIYKEAFTHEKARNIIINEKGKHFDPVVVDAFLKVENKFKQISIKYSDN